MTVRRLQGGQKPSSRCLRDAAPAQNHAGARGVREIRSTLHARCALRWHAGIREILATIDWPVPVSVGRRDAGAWEALTIASRRLRVERPPKSRREMARTATSRYPQSVVTLARGLKFWTRTLQTLHGDANDKTLSIGVRCVSLSWRVEHPRNSGHERQPSLDGSGTSG